VKRERKDFVLAKSDMKKMIQNAQLFMKRYRFRKDPSNQKKLNELPDVETLLQWESGTQFMGDESLIDKLIAKVKKLKMNKNQINNITRKKEEQ